MDVTEKIDQAMLYRSLSRRMNKVREILTKNQDYKCSVCNSIVKTNSKLSKESAILHHQSFIDKNHQDYYKFDKIYQDLTVVCLSCHRKIHSKARKAGITDNNSWQTSTEELERINLLKQKSVQKFGKWVPQWASSQKFIENNKHLWFYAWCKKEAARALYAISEEKKQKDIQSGINKGKGHVGITTRKKGGKYPFIKYIFNNGKTALGKEEVYSLSKVYYNVSFPTAKNRGLVRRIYG